MNSRFLLPGVLLSQLCLLFSCLPAREAEAEPEPVWTPHTTQAPDGTNIDFLLHLPEGQGPFPVVVFLHGAPGGVGQPGLQRLTTPARWTALREAGIAVCIADYRGHPANRPFEVLKGDVNATDDVAAVVGALAREPHLDLSRLAMMGNSLGGATTLQTIAEGKIHPRCLVLNAPASFVFIGLRGRPKRDAALTDEDIDRAAALRRIASLTMPTLIIQGDADGLAPINQKLAGLMTSAGCDVQLTMYPGEGHSFTNGPDSPAFRQAVTQSLDFITAHLLVPPPAP